MNHANFESINFAPVQQIKPLDRHSDAKQSVCQNITANICQMIAEGQLNPGQKLPSVRTMASILNTSKSTVMRAYEELAIRRLITTRKGSSTCIAKRTCDFDASQLEFGSSPSNIKQVQWSEYALKAISTTSQHNQAHTANQSQSPSDIDTTNFINQMLKHKSEIVDLASQANPIKHLQGAICNYLAHYRGLHCTPDQILITTTGCWELIQKCFVNPGDLVAVEDPCPPSTRISAEAIGAEVVGIPVEGDTRTEFLSTLNQCKLLHVTPTCQNPTGKTLSVEKRIAILQWSATNGTVIFEDDSNSFVNYNSAMPLPTLFTLDQTQSVVYCQGFDKLFGSLCNISFMVLPARLLETVRSFHQSIRESYSILEVATLTAILKGQSISRYVRESRAIYKGRRQKVIHALAIKSGATIKHKLETTESRILIKIKFDIPRETVLRLAADTGLHLESTDQWYLGTAPANEYSLDFRRIDESQIETAIENFAAALSGLVNVACNETSSLFATISVQNAERFMM